MKIKTMTNMKNLFTGSSLQWPDLQWINTDSLIKSKTLSEVPEGMCEFEFEFECECECDFK